MSNICVIIQCQFSLNNTAIFNPVLLLPMLTVHNFSSEQPIYGVGISFLSFFICISYFLKRCTSVYSQEYTISFQNYANRNKKDDIYKQCQGLPERLQTHLKSMGCEKQDFYLLETPVCSFICVFHLETPFFFGKLSNFIFLLIQRMHVNKLKIALQ